MLQETNPRLLAMPTDEELYSEFMAAAQEGAHDDIKGIVDTIIKYSSSAKGEIKRMVNFDATSGLSLNFNKQVGNDVLKGFLDSQPMLLKPAVKLSMSKYNATTFDEFVAKIKEKPENVELTTNTLSRIFLLFFQKVGVKYAVNETVEHINASVAAVFN